MGVEIVGVGFQDPATNAGWVADQGYQYEIWTDEDRTLSVTYGAADSALAFFPDRVTVLLDAQGDLLLDHDAILTLGSAPVVVDGATRCE